MSGGRGPAYADRVSGRCGRHTVAAAEATAPPARNAWYLPERLVSLAGTPVWDRLPIEQRQRLARHEAALAASQAIQGEDHVLAGLRPRSIGGDYLAVFAGEEEQHQEMFRAYLAHLGLAEVPARTLAFTARELTEPAFFACTLVFEDIAARHNRIIAGDDTVHPVARAVNRAHAVDEAQHLRFGRATLARLLGTESEQTIAATRELVTDYLRALLREWYRSDVYAAAGLPDAWQLPELAWAAPAQVERRVVAVRHALAGLDRLDIDAEQVAG